MRCAEHGLQYDPQLQAGCVVCRRAQQPERATRAAVWSWARALIGYGALIAVLFLAARPVQELLAANGGKDRSPNGARAPYAKSAASPPEPAPGPPLRVLFVGNSFTFMNDLPGLVARLASAAGERRFESQQSTVGGWGLREHAAAGRVQQLLAQQRWDVVVLQDQSQRPSFAPIWRKEWFEDPARTLVTAVKGAGARAVLYETFAHRVGNREVPTDSFDAMQARLDRGFGLLSEELGIEVVPVGPIWAQLYHSHPQLNLWANDGMHPNRAGSYLAACALYVQLFGHSPVDNTFTADIAADDAALIQRTVAAFMSARAGTPGER